MRKTRMFRASAFAFLLTLLLLPRIAHANNVAVNCPVGSLNAAVAGLPPSGPNTITVTGVCNETVSITNVQSLTIAAGAGGAKIVAPQDSDAFDIFQSLNIRLVGLEIAGVPGSIPGGGGNGVFITEASDVRILGCDIHDNQAGGVVASNGAVLLLSNNTNIHNNNPLDGLDVLSNSTADVKATTIQNNGSPGFRMAILQA